MVLRRFSGAVEARGDSAACPFYCRGHKLTAFAQEVFEGLAGVFKVPFPAVEVHAEERSQRCRGQLGGDL